MALRLSRADRREQLLDTAADFLVEQGVAALTVEGLALRAGVSKALPYVHFENADDVMVALYQREVANMGERIVAAMATQPDPESRLAAAVKTYFALVEERGAILAILTRPGSIVPQRADSGSRVGNNFVAEILERDFGVPRRRGLLAASMIQGLLNGAVDAWAHGEASRSRTETTAIAAVLHIAHTASEG